MFRANVCFEWVSEAGVDGGRETRTTVTPETRVQLQRPVWLRLREHGGFGQMWIHMLCLKFFCIKPDRSLSLTITCSRVWTQPHKRMEKVDEQVPEVFTNISATCFNWLTFSQHINKTYSQKYMHVQFGCIETSCSSDRPVEAVGQSRSMMCLCTWFSCCQQYQKQVNSRPRMEICRWTWKYRK